MRRILPFCLLVCLPLAAQQAPIPAATALSGDPFFIKKTWPIGGSGNWDYLTLDVQAQRLYIAHGHAVQVVDVASGSLAGEIAGFREARAVALDATGVDGYVSDWAANTVTVFNRATLKAEASIPIGCSPRFLAFEPQSKLVFALCGPNPASARPGQRQAPPETYGLSLIVIIDAARRAVAADIALDGDFRVAQPDGSGSIYATAAKPGWIAKFDAAGIAAEAQRKSGSGAVHFDWSHHRQPPGLVQSIALHASCQEPQGLAVDGKDLRLFVACENQTLQVLNADHGEIVASLVTGPGDDVIGYDADRGLIYSANGGGYGSLTIVRQDANTDSYAVVQTLPTMAQARTLAVDPSTGEVYLVTDVRGVDLTKPGGIGTLRSVPIQGSFQVIVVGR